MSTSSTASNSTSPSPPPKASMATAGISPAQAMAAAAGIVPSPTFPKDSPSAPALPTPMSATYPPSAHTGPPSAVPPYMKRDEAIQTPLTPPSAYLDFLRILSPSIHSPMSTGNSSVTGRFSFSDSKSPAGWITPVPGAETMQSPNRRPRSALFPHTPGTAPLPATSRSFTGAPRPSTLQTSTSAAAMGPTSAGTQTSATEKTPHTSTAATFPAPPPPRPGAVRRPSLIIPPSPSHSTRSFSPKTAITPASAMSAPAGGCISSARTPIEHPLPPTSAAPVSAAPVSATAEGRTTYSVRHVITRTITYTRRVDAGPSSAGSSAATPGAGPASAPGSARLAPLGHDLARPGSAGPMPARPKSATFKREYSGSLKAEAGGEASTRSGRATPLVGEAPRGKRRKVR